VEIFSAVVVFADGDGGDGDVKHQDTKGTKSHQAVPQRMKVSAEWNADRSEVGIEFVSCAPGGRGVRDI
jgi:hypothetical protein